MKRESKTLVDPASGGVAGLDVEHDGLGIASEQPIDDRRCHRRGMAAAAMSATRVDVADCADALRGRIKMRPARSNEAARVANAEERAVLQLAGDEKVRFVPGVPAVGKELAQLGFVLRAKRLHRCYPGGRAQVRARRQYQALHRTHPVDRVPLFETVSELLWNLQQACVEWWNVGEDARRARGEKDGGVELTVDEGHRAISREPLTVALASRVEVAQRVGGPRGILAKQGADDVEVDHEACAQYTRYPEGGAL